MARTTIVAPNRRDENDHTHGQKRFEIAVSQEAGHYADAEAPLRLRRRPTSIPDSRGNVKLLRPWTVGGLTYHLCLSFWCWFGGISFELIVSHRCLDRPARHARHGWTGPVRLDVTD